jgi:hypothetical protein
VDKRKKSKFNRRSDAEFESESQEGGTQRAYQLTANMLKAVALVPHFTSVFHESIWHLSARLISDFYGSVLGLPRAHLWNCGDKIFRNWKLTYST